MGLEATCCRSRQDLAQISLGHGQMKCQGHCTLLQSHARCRSICPALDSWLRKAGSALTHGPKTGVSGSANVRLHKSAQIPAARPSENLPHLEQKSFPAKWSTYTLQSLPRERLRSRTQSIHTEQKAELHLDSISVEKLTIELC